MGFINPALLYGIGAFLIPIIIYIIFQRKVKEMDWAAMQFLLDIIEERKKKINIEEMLLLLLRTLMILFLALAVCRPFLASSAGGGLLGSGGKVLLVLDNSYSMATVEGTRSRWQKTSEQATNFIDTLPEGTGISVLFANEQPDLRIPDYAVDHGFVSETIKAASPSALRSDPRASLEMIKQVVSASPDGIDVIFVSDFQASDWAQLDSSLKQTAEEIAQQGSLSIVPISDTVTRNIGVSELKCLSGSVRNGARTTFTAKISNHSDENIEDLVVELVVDNRVEESRSINLGPNSDGSIRFPYVSDKDGLLEVSVRVPADANPLDNAAFLSVASRDAIPVLAITEDPDADFRPSDFYELALNPFAERSEHPEALYNFKNVSSSDIASERLLDYELVIVAQLQGFTSYDAELLEQYVKAGGALVIFLGSESDSGSYNATLHRGGEGLLPFPVSDEIMTASTEDDPLTFNPESAGHPFWGSLLDTDTGYFNQLYIFQSWGFVQDNLDSSTDAGAESDAAQNRAIILGTARNDERNEAIIIDSKLGRGHAIIFGTSLDLSMNNFAIRKSFVAVMRQMTSFLTAFRRGDSTVNAGDLARLFVNFEQSQATYQIVTPSKEEYAKGVLQKDEQYIIDLDDLTEVGIYRLTNQDNPEDMLAVAVNTRASEGAITTLGLAEIEALFAGTALQIAEDAADAQAGSSGSEIAWLLLILMLLCWLGENLLARRMSRQ